MKFITRGYSAIHIAEQELSDGLPEWRKMPYCRNGGLNLKAWSIVDIEPTDVRPDKVCRACVSRAVANGFMLPFMPGYPHERDE